MYSESGRQYKILYTLLTLGVFGVLFVFWHEVMAIRSLKIHEKELGTVSSTKTAVVQPTSPAVSPPTPNVQPIPVPPPTPSITVSSTTEKPVETTRPTPPPVPTPTTPAPTPAEESSGRPDALTLTVPFTSQAPQGNWDQPWQDACEEAALLMVDAYYKGYTLSPLFARDELIKLVDWGESQGFGLSIPIENIRRMGVEVLGLNKHGTPTVITNPTADQIKDFIAAKKPVLVVADGKILPNPNFRGGGPEYHALVIKGYTKDTFITNDPGTRLGNSFVYKIPDLMNSIRDWNGGDVKHAARVIMVVE